MIAGVRRRKKEGRREGEVAGVRVKVAPGAREDAVVGWQGDVLRLRVRAAPDGGKANDAVCRLLARALGVPPSAVTIARGASSREKLVQIQGPDDEDIRRRLVATVG